MSRLDAGMIIALDDRLHQEDIVAETSIEVGTEARIVILATDEVDQDRLTIEMVVIGVAAQDLEMWTMRQICPFCDETRGMYRMCKSYSLTRLIGKQMFLLVA